MSQTVEAVSAEPRTLLLAGVPTSSAESLDVVFPYDGSGASRVCLGDEAIIEQALDSAAAAEAEVAFAAAVSPRRDSDRRRRARALARSGAGAADDDGDGQRDLGNAARGPENRRDPSDRRRGGARRSTATGELVPIDAVPRGEVGSVSSRDSPSAPYWRSRPSTRRSSWSPTSWGRRRPPATRASSGRRPRPALGALAG